MRAEVRAAGRMVRPVGRASRALRSAPWLTVVGWHRFGSTVDDGLTTSMTGFLRHLDELEDWGARVLPLDEAMRRLADGTLPERAVVLTFDDGYASVVEQAWPVLLDRGWPATLYAVSGYLDPSRRLPWDAEHPDAGLVRLMSRSQLLEAAASGLDVGSHTHRHSWLPHQDPQSLRDELAGSRARLEDLLDRPVRSVAYPAGGWDERVRRAAEDAGYSVGITVDRGITTARTDALAVRRAFAPERADDLRLILDGACTWLKPLDAWRSRHGREDLR